MIVVAILSVLAMIALPRFGDVIRRSKEAAIKGHLGSLRSALSIYYSENEGEFAGGLEQLTIGGRYLDQLPFIKVPVHHEDDGLSGSGYIPASGVGHYVCEGCGTPGRPWGYNDVMTAWMLVVNCTHTDIGGRIWSDW
jgi:type II secretory pathway pseudopilin PulG